MRRYWRIGILAATVALIGCSTSTQFKLPVDTEVLIKGKRFPAATDKYVNVNVRPFFWTGIPYRLLQGDKVLHEGKLESRFRVASIFWPPYALLYWPLGFSQRCYDLATTPPGPCVWEGHEEQKETQPAASQANAVTMPQP